MFWLFLLLLFVVVVVDNVNSQASNSVCKTSSSSSSEVSGPGACSGDIFLRGNYVEVGIHSAASYGTYYNAPASSAYAYKRLGFIADYDKNGFSGSPGFAGDYFVPGAPVEGWVVQFEESGSTKKAINMGLYSMSGVVPQSNEITSTASTQSTLWVGKYRDLKVSKVTQFDNDDVYFTTSVTLENTGSTPLTNVYYQRTVDPDQERVYYYQYRTLNYVKYQPAAEDGSDCCLSNDYVNPDVPSMSLVVAVGKNNKDFFLGMGSTNPSIRVSHFGFYSPYPNQAYGDGSGNTEWHSYGGNDVEPIVGDEHRMQYADKAIHLTWKTATLGPGEVAQFSYAHVLNEADLAAAMSTLTIMSFIQPTADMSGSSTVTVALINHTATTCDFSLYGTKLSVSSSPQWYDIGTNTPESATHSFSIVFDSRQFEDGAVQLRAVATDGSETYSQYKAAGIANAGTQMVFIQDDGGGTYPFSNSGLTYLNMTKEYTSDLDPVSISFYLEVFFGGEVSSTLINTVTAPPYETSVDVSSYYVGQSVSVKASVVSGVSSQYKTTTIFSGVVTLVNNAPSDITLSASNILEGTLPGVAIGSFSSVDADAGQGHSYTLVDDAGGLVEVVGGVLMVSKVMNFESGYGDYYGTSFGIRVRTDDGQSNNCCFEKDFVVTISDKNDVPLSISPSTIVVQENTAINTVVGTLSTVDEDCCDSHTYSLLTYEADFAISSSTGQISVTGSIDFESQTSYTLAVRTTDNGSPNEKMDTTVTVSVQDINESPTDITISCNPCTIDENTVDDTVVASLSAVDVDASESHTFSVEPTLSTPYLTVDAAGDVRTVGDVDYEDTGPEIVLYAKVTDKGGLFVIKPFTFLVQNLPEVPTSEGIICFCDEDLIQNAIVSSKTEVDPLFCQVPASGGDSEELLFTIKNGDSVTTNSENTFTIQSCSGMVMVNNSDLLDYEYHDFYNFTVQIDSVGGSVQSYVVIHVVNVNEAPVFSPLSVAIPENSAIGTEVVASLLGQVSDPDDVTNAGDFCCEKQFEIVSGNRDSVFYIMDATTGQIGVNTLGLNFESISQYSLVVVVADKGGLIDVATITVNVTDLNEAPVLVDSSGTFSTIPEDASPGDQTGLGIYAIDVDEGQTLNFAITGGNTDDAFTLSHVYDVGLGLDLYYFTIAGGKSLDYETTSSYSLEVTVTDDHSSPLSDVGVFVISVTDVNEAPSLPSTKSFSIVENSNVGTLVGTALVNEYTDPDAGSTASFSIHDYHGDGAKYFDLNSTTGQLSLRSTFLSYETVTSFLYTIHVTDGGGLFDSCDVTISVTDVNEEPVWITPQPGDVLEGVDIGANVTLFGEPLAFDAVDDDSDSLTFSIVSVNGDTESKDQFTIQEVSGENSIYLQSNVVFDYETLSSYTVVLSAADGEFTVNSPEISISVVDQNDAPTISASTQDCYVADGAASGTTICQIIGVDEDSDALPWGTLTYAFPNGTSYTGLSIATSEGVGILTVADSSSWTAGDVMSGIIVRAIDGGSPTLEDQQTISLTVTSANQPPVCPTNPLSFSLSENTAGGYSFGVLSSSSNSADYIYDASPLICSITAGNSAGHFAVSSSCELTTTGVPTDFESRNSFTLTILAVEDNGASSLLTSCTVAIAVTDINEPTTLESQSFETNEISSYSGPLHAPGGGEELTVVIIDEDAEDQPSALADTFSLTCISCAADPLDIDANTGVLQLKADFSLNFESVSSYLYNVTWSSRGVTETARLDLTILDVNEPPLAFSDTIAIDENLSPSTIGYISATDPDFEDEIDFGSSYCGSNCGLVYSIVSSTSGAFVVDAVSGAITLTSLGVDYENAVSHTINVKVTDSGGLACFTTITVDVSDVADCAISLISDMNGGALNATATEGGSMMLLTGRNFGPTMARMSAAGMSEGAITLTASIQSGGVAASSSYVFSMPCTMYRVSPHDNTAMNCTVPAGISSNLGAVVTIEVDYGGGLGVSSCTTALSASKMSYGVPVVNSISTATGLPTAGGSAVTISGSNFGAKGVEYNLVTALMNNAYFSSTINCAVTTAHTAVSCTAASGIGSNVDWTLSVGGQTSAVVSGQSSYGIPTISSVTSSESFATSGGVSFTLLGTNIGDDIMHIVVTYGPTTGSEYVASCSIEVAHTTLKCLSSAGVGSDLKFKVMVAAQESSIKDTSLRYKSPVISGLSGAGTSFASTSGGDIVYITGSNFGPLSTSMSDIVVTYGEAASEFTAVSCHVLSASTKIQCLTAVGTGKGHGWRVSIASQLSDIFAGDTSYAPPTVSSFDGDGSSTALTSGYQSVIINGLNFGSDYTVVDRIYYSEPNKTQFDVTENCTMTTAHTVLSCLTAPGAGVRLSWSIVVDGQESVSPTTSYGPPKISSLSGVGVSDADVSGGQEVILTGLNFGTPNSLGVYGTEFLELVTYGPTGTEYKAANCVVQASTRIRCETVAGVGGGLFWQVTVASQVSDLSTATSSYAAPHISTMTPSIGDTDGSTTVLLEGTNFATNTNPIVFFGNNENICANEEGVCSCDGEVHYGRKYTTGKPGNGSLTSFSDMQQWTYFSKTVSGSTLCSDSNFGDPAFGYYKHCICVPTEPTVEVVSSLAAGENSLTFFVPEAVQVQSDSYLVYISVGGQLSNTMSFSYSDPVIYTLNTVDSVNETITLVITGAFFSLKPIVRVDETDSGQTTFPFCTRFLHEEIECSVVSRSGRVVVTTFGESNALRYEYGEPRLLSSDLQTGLPLTSGYTSSNPAQLFIIGQNFGKLQTDFVVNIEFLYKNVLKIGECTVTLFQYVSKQDNLAEWERVADLVEGEDVDSDLQQLTCNLPPGHGSDNSIRIVRPNSYSLGCGCLQCSEESCFSYAAPEVSSVNPPTGNTEGGYTVILSGSNFGLNASVEIGGDAWEVDNALSGHTEIHLTSNAFEGSNHLVKVTAGNQDNSAQSGGAQKFSYNTPTIDPLLSTLLIGSEGSTSSLTVSGSNFGVLGPTVTLGEEKIVVLSFTHSTLEFNIPPGQGKNLVLAVNVSDQIGYSTDSFSYIPPEISTVSRLTGDTQGGRLSNKSVTTITGTNFGFVDKPFSLRFGENFVVPMQDIVSYTSTEIQFYHPPGEGTNVLVNLTVGGQSSTGPPFYFDYNPPEITTVVFPADVNTDGGSVITIQGTSFGLSAITVTISDPLFVESVPEIAATKEYAASSDSFRMDPRECETVSHSHTEIVCTVPPGVGTGLVMSVNVGGQVTSANFSYSPPAISYYQQDNGGNAAGGETLIIHGTNFGAWRTPLNISLGSELCLNSVWLADDPVYDYKPYLKCTTPREKVGYKNVTVFVAFQVSEMDDRYEVTCKKGYYGGVGEYCVDCGDPEDTGLVCDKDGLYEPLSYNGWYLSYSSSESGDCPEENADRDSCPVVQPCIPKDSCLGNNTCAVEYEGDRCAVCAEGYYRINGLCQECPSAPWAIVVAGVGVLICGGYIAWKLQKKNVNLGIMSIGIDYFQVLAVFGSANVTWPQSLVNMYNSFSIFNLNVDVAAPDCWDAVSMSFRTKWYGISASPIAVIAVLIVATTLYVIFFRVRGIKINYTETLYKTFAVYILFFYYGYLMLSNNTLAVFNCQPTTPSDGYRYMVEIGADGGRCYKAGTLQQELEPWAIITFIVYTVGFPAFVAFVLYTHRDKAIYAQVMLAAGKANNSDYEKQSITRFRMLYNRLYYQFKPEYFYWIFFILIRKFCLSVSAVIFRENTVFLLALYLLILFCCYTLNVNYKPYMSTSEYPDIVEKYQHVLSMNQRETAGQTRRSFAPNIRKLGGDDPIFKAKTATIEFFNNYNTVESYLLFSAIMVAIAAIMFESDQLSEVERDSLAYLVISIVAVSLGYFAFVLFTELWIAFFPHIPLFWMKIQEEDEELDHDIEFADVAMASNKHDDEDTKKIKAEYENKLENAEGKYFYCR